MLDKFINNHYYHPTIDRCIDYLSQNEFNNPIMKKLKEAFSPPEFVNPLTIDLHSHLLPGIDDGVRTMEESLKLIKKFKSLGYTKLITTPHIISDSYPNTKEIIYNKLSEVKEAVKNANINIEIEAGAEHYIDMDFLELVKQNELVPFCGNYVLFETSYISKPVIMEQAIFDMQAKGYIPVLAHPERYKYMYNDISSYQKLKDIGVLFQVNTKSLSHSSGSVYEMALKLLNLGFIDFLGSDAHRMRDLVNFEDIMQKRIYKRVFDQNNILNMSKLNIKSTNNSRT